MTYLNEKYTTKVIIKCSPSNSEVYISDNTNNYEKNILSAYLTYNIYVDYAYITIYLRDKFGNYINNDDEVEIIKDEDDDGYTYKVIDMDLVYERRLQITFEDSGQYNASITIKKGGDSHKIDFMIKQI